MEERKAAYDKARERIFGKDDKSGEATPGAYCQLFCTQ